MKKVMHQIGEGEIEITFDDLQYQFLSSDNPPYDKTYECRGYDSDGNIYSGIAEFSCDELVEITDIECIRDVVCERMYELYKGEVKAGIYDPKNPHETLEQKMEKARNLKRFGIDYEV